MLPPLITSLASVLGCHFAGRVLAVDTHRRVCPDLVITAFDVQDRRHLAGDPLAHEPMLCFVLLEQLGVGVERAAHSTAITLEGLVVGKDCVLAFLTQDSGLTNSGLLAISPFAQNGY